MEETNGFVSLPLPDAAPPDGLWPELVVQGWERSHNHIVSPDGRRVAFYLDRNGHTDLWVANTDGSGFPQQITLNRPHSNWWEEEPAAWTPDSHHLVYGAYDEYDVSHLYVVSADGGQPRQLTQLSTDASEPSVSPDGRYVVFSAERNGTTQIGVVPLDGGWTIGVTSGDLECSGPSWSPDGSRIIYHGARPHQTRENDVYAVSFITGQRLQAHVSFRLTPNDQADSWNATYAPDGGVIAVLSNATGYDEIWLMAPDGSRLSQLTHLNLDIESFAWSPDGKRIVCVAGDHGADRLLVVLVDGGEAQQVPAPSGTYASPQWLPAGDGFVVGFDSPSCPPDIFVCDANTGALKPLTCFNTPALRNFDWVSPRHVFYDSFDGWQIPALFYAPSAKPADARGRPAIVYPHGGPTADYSFMWDPIRQYFVAKGYAVIAPNFRGSTGYGRQFKDGNLNNWGMGDLQDCLHAADYLALMPEIDRERIAIWGQSYGGYLTNLALAKDPRYRFRCGVSLFGDSNLLTSWARGDHSGRQDVEWQMGVPHLNRKRYEMGSPIHFAGNIKAPMLVLHGERDARVHVDESHQLVAELKRLGKTYEFKTYAEEAHGFSHAVNALDVLGRIERFLDWHLM
ncbi:MAG TPA: S9 family peptidase [Thermoflexales bacterium]|nr:S9 family peptidase [Thermoflexales bacterium]HQW34622.1 S9 family peptidase [Thermoflexales bacterium]HQZ22867.1 S9 family peptidase [Thermoflexales bacterium]